MLQVGKELRQWYARESKLLAEAGKGEQHQVALLDDSDLVQSILRLVGCRIRVCFLKSSASSTAEGVLCNVDPETQAMVLGIPRSTTREPDSGAEGETSLFAGAYFVNIEAVDTIEHVSVEETWQVDNIDLHQLFPFRGGATAQVLFDLASLSEPELELLRQRKQLIVDRLTKLYIPVSLSDGAAASSSASSSSSPSTADFWNISVMGSQLTICPPYTAASCFSESDIILNRIQTIMDKLPE